MKWRTIFTDSESLTGIAPECPKQETDHLGGLADVYDCCPHPRIECYGEASAAALAVFLTALGAEPCS